MLRELYRIEDVDGRKAIHYHGFLWDDGDGPHVEEAAFCGLGGRGTPVAYIDSIQGSKYAFMCDLLEQVHQYGGPIPDEDMDGYIAAWGGRELHMDDVTCDTPCGAYWFDVE